MLQRLEERISQLPNTQLSPDCGHSTLQTPHGKRTEERLIKSVLRSQNGKPKSVTGNLISSNDKYTSGRSLEPLQVHYWADLNKIPPLIKPI